MRDLSRLFAPKSIAVIGGGAWCTAIMSAAKQIGFDGTLLPVHPSGKLIAGIPSITNLAEFPGPIDAAFIGVNRFATLDVVAQLRDLDAGGAICFASGFSEAAAEDATGTDLQAQLVGAAGDMPIMGPNCYGFLNALEGAGIWPDQHGLSRVDRGVAILTQSSNILINITMQMRGLPIAMAVACGNQAQTRQTDVAMHLLDDPRITAIGLHIEGFGDLRSWEALAKKAHAKNRPLIALKSGRSPQAQAAAVSHTASLAGGDAGAAAFLARLGIRRADNLPVFLEALKIAHLFGPMPRGAIASISCSGGEAALAADTALGTTLNFPPLNTRQTKDLGAALGPMVALANPLDYHTYIWRDGPAMTAAWAAMADPHIDITLLIIDYPRPDKCDASDWDIATQAAIDAAAHSGGRFAVVASLPELLPESVAHHLMAHGVLALHGLDHSLAALHLMSGNATSQDTPVTLPGADKDTHVLTEAAAKAQLATFGLPTPKGQVATPDQAPQVATQVGFPVALKVQGLAHKTGANGLALGLKSESAVLAAVADLAPGDILVEHMVDDAVVELLIGVTRDPAHGFVLTLAAGGTLTEVLSDKENLLVPADADTVEAALNRLKIAPLLHGYRGKPAVHMTAVLDAVAAIQAYVVANADRLEEVEINPLLCTPTQAVAVDALIRTA